MYKQDLAWNIIPGLICHKTQLTNQPITNLFLFFFIGKIYPKQVQIDHDSAKGYEFFFLIPKKQQFSSPDQRKHTYNILINQLGQNDPIGRVEVRRLISSKLFTWKYFKAKKPLSCKELKYFPNPHFLIVFTSIIIFSNFFIVSHTDLHFMTSRNDTVCKW